MTDKVHLNDEGHRYVISKMSQKLPAYVADDAPTKEDIEQIIDTNDGSFILKNKTTGRTTRRCSYVQFAYLDGFVGCTAYYAGKEGVYSVEEFMAMCAVTD